MLEELEVHNQFHDSIARFRSHDPHLRRLSSCSFVYKSKLLEERSFLKPGIYLITGGRQIGKTTFLKQLIEKWLAEGEAEAKNIQFITGEIIDTHHILRRFIQSFHASERKQILFIDEVNYIPDWDKTIKYIADAGMTESMSIILTGSDNRIIKAAMKRFAGRRGMEDRVDFEFSPLSFLEVASLIKPELQTDLNTISLSPLPEGIGLYQKHSAVLKKLFNDYLLHGGFLPAINSYYSTGKIQKAVFNTYIHWIVGDVLKNNKTENYLIEVLGGIVKSYGSRVSWNSLAKNLSIDHHMTISDYCHILQDMNVLYIQEALREDKLSAAPKKQKKIHFRDPFIAHAVSAYITESDFDSISTQIRNPEISSSLVESVCVAHCKRLFPTYYISGTRGEVDIAVVKGNTFLPMEVKWTTQLRPEELKQISVYKDGLILTPANTLRPLGNNTVAPLLQVLLQASKGQVLFQSRSG